MEDKRFQALRPIEKSWMYGNLSALRDCLEQAYDLGHAAASQAELDKMTQDRDEWKGWTKLYKHGCEKAERENDELKAKIAALEQKLADVLEVRAGYPADIAMERLEKAERERDQAREALRWIPVGERLPDTAREVNVLIVSNPTLGSGEKVDVTIVMLGHYRSSGWIDDDGEELGTAVKAWADYPPKTAVPPSEDAQEKSCKPKI